MVVSIGLISLIIVVSTTYGWGSFKLLTRIFNIQLGRLPRLSLLILLGMSTLMWIAQFASLLFPLSLGVFLIVMGGGAVIAWYFFKNKRINIHIPLPIICWILLTLVSISILENGTHTPINPDTGIYHAQAIRWIESFRAVPGLGNLHTRFAFNSSWLVLNALFSMSFLNIQSFHSLPAAISLVAVIDFSIGAIDWIRKGPTIANILRTILLPIFFFVLGSQISSPGTDLPVILFLWLIVPAWLENTHEDSSLSLPNSILLFFCAVSMVTIKMSALPVLLFCAFTLYKYRRPHSLALKFAALGLVILLPWILRNIILSGYLVYPLPAIDLFMVDWKIPIEIARSEVLSILAWARDPGIDMEEVLAKPLGAWLKLWFIEKTTNQKIIMVFATLSSLFLSFTIAFRDRLIFKKTIHNMPIISAFGVPILGAIYWLLTAPDIRFGYGYLFTIIGLAVAIMVLMIEPILGKGNRYIKALILIGLIGYQFVFLTRSIDLKTLNSRWIIPRNYPIMAYESCPFGNGMVFCPTIEAWTECWYEPFPCIPTQNDWAEQRGPNWVDGFRPKLID